MALECSGKGSDRGCRRQTSVIAGPVMRGTHLRLRKWFLAAYLMHDLGASAPAQARRFLQDVVAAAAQADGAQWSIRTGPLSGTVDVDESSIPYRRKDDALKRGGGSSKANQIWIAGAVETVGRFGVGRVRLARIADRSAASLVPFVEANTLLGTKLRTDHHAPYDKVPGRPLTRVNINKSKLPAHLLLKWPHVVFGALGTFHGFREKHLDA
ncbi:hypothetical protein X749_30550 [Mesorhizobium sp. LNJC391B00]|nr:hypothetical protein X749_30550 [Mesorhizobium sp. LNJC391B00]